MSTTVTSFYWSYDKGRMPLNVRTIYRKVSLTSGAPFAFHLQHIFERCSGVCVINKEFLVHFFTSSNQAPWAHIIV